MSNMGFIEALLSQKDESARLRLLAEYNAETVMRIVCAFLNNDGGWIVIGASEDGARTGVDVEAVVADIQRNAVQRIKPLPLVYIHAEDYQDGKVVLVTVMKGGLPPYSFDSSYYTIAGDQVVKPNTDEVNLLIRRSMSSSSSWEKSTCLDAEWEDLNVNLMHEVVSKGLERGRLDERNNTPEKLLGNLQLVDTPNVKNGAMALFGQEAPRFLPQSRMRIQVMLGGQYWNYKISDPTAKNDLQQMVNARLCRKDGSGPATRYVVLANN